jgi:hypothetical protein
MRIKFQTLKEVPLMNFSKSACLRPPLPILGCSASDPEFVNLIRSTRIDFQPGGIDTWASKCLQIRAGLYKYVACQYRSTEAKSKVPNWGIKSI